MAVSLQQIVKFLLRTVWKLIQKTVSFLTTVVILTALTVSVLYMMKIKPYVVTTGSMEPAIPVHSICFVNENIPLEQISVGEVISFRIGAGQLVTHRVSDIHEGEYTTKGDANNSEDHAPVTLDNYIGKTAVVIPKAGIIIIFLHTRTGKYIAVSVILLLLILSFIPTKKNLSAQAESERKESADGTNKD
ncbi:MAG: signal peptidase I [Oscillospiraceae bacterium]|nr:signal peptidase I [Oscillospiraceae bacterium]